MRRWDPLNDRQLDLLKRIDNGEARGRAGLAPMRQTATALSNRGLIKINRRGEIWNAEVTEAGRFFLDHGHHPNDPRATSSATDPSIRPTRQTKTPSSSDMPPKPVAGPRTGRREPPHATVRTAAQRRAEAEELVQRLATEKIVVVKAPTDTVIANWRKIVDFAKRHHLVPDGYRIEKARQWNRDRDLHITLIKGRHFNKTNAVATLPAVPVPETLRRPHPVVADLRDDPGRLVMPKPVRRRSLLILHALAADATRRGYQVTKKPVADHHYTRYHGYGDRPRQQYSRRDGELNVTADGFTYPITIQQTSPQSADPDRIERLVIELPRHHRDGAEQRWADGKIRRIEDALPAVLAELAARAVADREREEQEEQARAERRVQWERAMATAKRKAAETYYAKVLDQQVTRWRHAHELRRFRDELAQRLDNPRPSDDNLDAARQWLGWIDQHITRTDPTDAPPAMPDPGRTDEQGPQATPLGTWSPEGPDEHIPYWQRR